ncbi:MAG TPA: hypothetical protein VFS00_20950 [Polyangiaceae bacterium]|nr:hypothetical protein [Polyangiaceae bacterium]
MRIVLTVPVALAFLGGLWLYVRHGLRHLFVGSNAGGPWGGAAPVLARTAVALGASGGGDLMTDGAFVLPLGGRSFQVFGARPGKGGNRVVGLGLDVVASNVAAAAGSPFRVASRRPALARLPRVELRRGTEFEHLGKRLGLNLEICTGDARFDALVYVDSDAPRDDVAAVLADERVRRGALALFDAGCAYVTFADGPHAISALWVSHLQTAISPDSLPAYASHLLDIADGLPPVRQVAAVPRARVRWPEIAYLVLGVFAMALGSASLALWPLLDRALVPLAAGLAVLTMVALLALGVVALRGRSDALLKLCFVAFGAAMLGPGLAVGGLNVANGWRDATTVEHPATIVGSHRAVLKKNSTYYISVAPWAPGGSPRDFAVSKARFDLAQTPEHRRAIVRTGAGRLGFEWLRSVDVP